MEREAAALEEDDPAVDPREETERPVPFDIGDGHAERERVGRPLADDLVRRAAPVAPGLRDPPGRPDDLHAALYGTRPHEALAEALVRCETSEMDRRVSAREAHELLENDGHRLVDVRSVAEFEAGHPAGALNLPWMFLDARGRSLNPDFVAVFERLFPDKDAKVVLSCQSGSRSMQALTALEARGYERLVDLRAGWGGGRDAFGQLSERGWLQEGLPTDTGAGGERSWETLRTRGLR
jgi:rhodanese-related sulfurtransferase